jgi:molybdopterin molybdotransferase
MISFEQASELILEAVHPSQPISRRIEDAVGYALCEDIIAPLAVPSFRNSAMDGFAIRAEWIACSSPRNPVKLPVGETIFAGDNKKADVKTKRAVKVMTGAPVPEGYDAVVKFEDASYDDHTVVFTQPVPSGQYIRLPGEDIAAGETLFRKGEVLNALGVGVLARIGLREVKVFSKPSVLVVVTGDELVEPGKPLPPMRSYNANGYTVSALIHPFCDKVERTALPDRVEALRAALDSGFDVIITSGGVSAGEKDMVIDIAGALGWRTVFHKVRIKPGKPTFFARRDQQLLIGLPGNPLSAAVACSIFAIPALKKLSGWRDYKLRLRDAALVPSSMRASDRTIIWPGKIRRRDAHLEAEFSPKTSSAALSAVLNSDGLIFLPPQDEHTHHEYQVKVVPWKQIFG